MGSKWRILLDLDGVLSDLVGGICEIWLIEKDELYEHWPQGEWNLCPYLGIAVEGEPWTEESFWQGLENCPDFWESLEPLPWFNELIDLAATHSSPLPGGSDWYLVSSPGKCISSYTGKNLWVRNHFGESFDRLLLTPHKHLLANPYTILIDDKEENCKRFRDSGGHSILFPARWNYLGELDKGVILFYLEDSIKAIKYQVSSI